MQNSVHTMLQDCQPDLVAIPFEPYKLSRKQYGTRKAHMKSNLMFTVNGRCGAPLVQSDPLEQLDGRLDRMFEGYGTKVAYVMQLPGYHVFKRQKYAFQKKHGQKISINREKVLQQVSEVIEAFMSSIQNGQNPLFFGPDGVRLEDLYLLEIRSVAKSSVQPILAVKKERLIHCGIDHAYTLTTIPSSTSGKGHNIDSNTIASVHDCQHMLDAGAVVGETTGIEARPDIYTSAAISESDVISNQQVRNVNNHTNVQDSQRRLDAGAVGGTVEAEASSALLYWLSGISADDMLPSLDLDVFPPLDDFSYSFP